MDSLAPVPFPPVVAHVATFEVADENQGLDQSTAIQAETAGQGFFPNAG